MNQDLLTLTGSQISYIDYKWSNVLHNR